MLSFWEKEIQTERKRQRDERTRDRESQRERDFDAIAQLFCYGVWRKDLQGTCEG